MLEVFKRNEKAPKFPFRGQEPWWSSLPFRPPRMHSTLQRFDTRFQINFSSVFEQVGLGLQLERYQPVPPD